jgi:Carboxypeptidase regulatory-like domain
MRSKTLLGMQLALLALLLAVFVPSLMAQSAGTSALSGIVTDPSGAAIPNVTVTITSNETAQTRSTTTGADGVYKFSLLPPGSYKIRFTATGFKTAEVGAVNLAVTESSTLDRTLEVGAQSEQVTVEASAETLQTESSTLGTTVGGATVTALPLSNRNYTQVLGMSAGANANVNNATSFGKATTNYSTNGADPGQNNFQMDGVAINNIANGGSSGDCGIYAGIPIPNPDAIQEFKIQTSTYDASYGRNPGANVNVITKSGSNAFHGGVWYFFRNEDLNARDFFENADNGGQQQILRQNQVGGSIGGPIKKDKLFFYANYQETRQLNGAVNGIGYEAVVLPPIPAGDRSAPGYQAQLGAALCPANHPGNAAAYETYLAFLPGFPEIACNGSNISPVAMNILNIKLPNGQYYIPTNNTGNFLPSTITDPATYQEHQLILNGDYVINSKNTGAPANVLYSNTDAVLKLTTLISPTLVNELRGSFQRNYQHETDTTPSTPQALGITPIIPQETEMTPFIIGNTLETIGGTLAPSYSPTTQMQIADQISWSHGRHTFRAGYEYEETQWNITFGGLLRGLIIFPTFADMQSCQPGRHHRLSGW